MRQAKTGSETMAGGALPSGHPARTLPSPSGGGLWPLAGLPVRSFQIPPEEAWHRTHPAALWFQGPCGMRPPRGAGTSSQRLGCSLGPPPFLPRPLSALEHPCLSPPPKCVICDVICDKHIPLWANGSDRETC